MRGKGTNVNRAERTAGITPACAGKRTRFDADMATSGDHPRVCGEKKKMQPRKDKRMGSPPRVRGKAQESFLILCHHGITPACAGKRTVTTKEAFQKQDHPRVCGEKVFFPVLVLLSQGSPPRVRGKAPPTLPALPPPRITPACAGKRLKRSHSIGHFSCILCLFHSVLHRASVSGGSRAGPCAPPCLPAQNAVPV